MRRFSLLRFALPLPLPLLALVTAMQANAQMPQGRAAARQPQEAAVTAKAQDGDTDAMLAALKRERDPDQARATASRIIATWSRSDSATVNLLLDWAAKAQDEDRFAAALDFLDQAIPIRPDFAGSWNERATLHFKMGQYEKSISDINRVLELEERHFGALSGLAKILMTRGSKTAALKAWARYLDIYPADRDVQTLFMELAEDLAGKRI